MCSLSSEPNSIFRIPLLLENLPVDECCLGDMFRVAAPTKRGRYNPLKCVVKKGLVRPHLDGLGSLFTKVYDKNSYDESCCKKSTFHLECDTLISRLCSPLLRKGKIQ